MTPAARWVRFNKNFTQQSGNGWYQHSEGTWEFNSVTKELKINNTNGYVDDYAPFKARVERNVMYWNRIEDGQEVEVLLHRADSIPESHIDKVMGVWDLVKATENSADITAQYDPESKWYIYYRWDRRFIIQNTPKGRLSGIYNVNGHVPAMEMVYDGTDCKRENWKFMVTQDSLILTSVGNDNEIQLVYKRIHYFPK